MKYFLNNYKNQIKKYKMLFLEIIIQIYSNYRFKPKNENMSDINIII